jgi:lysophospholipid acyltransferase
VIWLVAVVYRFKYYFAWAVSESALIFSGFCFNGWEAAPPHGEQGRQGGQAGQGGQGGEKPKWDRYANTRIRHVEFSTSAAELPAHWNTCTGVFLRRCALAHACLPCC